MSPILFADAIMQERPLPLFNHGHHMRDFTYIDDIAGGVLACLDRVATADAEWSPMQPAADSSRAPWRLYNIGRGEPVALLDYVRVNGESARQNRAQGIAAAQPGDVEETWADIEAL